MSNSKNKWPVKAIERALITAFFMAGTILLLAGFHTMDNAQNLRHVNGIMMMYNTSITFSEYTTIGSALTPDECYMLGFQETLYGGLTLIILSLTYVLDKGKEGGR